MSNNSYHSELNETFRGTRVRAHSGEHTYEGWARLWHFEDHELVLYDATREDGHELGAVTLHHPEAVERLSSMGHIREVPVGRIRPSPYSVREMSERDHEYFIQQTRERGHLLTFPTVRRLDDEDDNRETDATPPVEYEVVAGHRRLDAVQQAGLDMLAVRIEDLTAWEAVERFVADHVLLPGANQAGYYGDDEIERLLARLREDWDDERLRTLAPLAPSLRETLATTRRGALREGHLSSDRRCRE